MVKLNTLQKKYDEAEKANAKIKSLVQRQVSLTDVKKEKEVLEKKVAVMQKDAEELKNEQQKLRSDLAAQKKANQKIVSETESTIKSLSEKLAATAKTNDALRLDLATQEGQYQAELERVRLNAESEMSRMQQELARIQANDQNVRAEYETAIEEQKDIMQLMENRLKEMNASSQQAVDERESQISDLKERLDVVSDMVDQLRSVEAELESRIEYLSSEVESTKARALESDKTAKIFENRLKEATERYQTDMEESQATIVKLKATLASQGHTIDSMKEENERLLSSMVQLEKDSKNLDSEYSSLLDALSRSIEAQSGSAPASRRPENIVSAIEKIFSELLNTRETTSSVLLEEQAKLSRALSERDSVSKKLIELESEYEAEKETFTAEIQALSNRVKSLMDEKLGSETKLNKMLYDTQLGIRESISRFQSMFLTEVNMDHESDSLTLVNAFLESASLSVNTKFTALEEAIDDLRESEIRLDDLAREQETRIVDLESVKANLDAELEDAKKVIADLMDQKAGLEADVEQMRSNLGEVSQSLASQLSEAQAELRRVNTEYEQRETEMSSDIETLRQSLEETSRQETTLREQLSQVSALLESKESELNETIETLEKNMAENEALKTSVAELNERLHAKLAESAEQTTQYEALKLKSDAHVRDLEESLDLNKELTAIVEENQREVDTLRDELASKDDSIESLREEIEILEQSVAERQQEVDNLREQIDRTKMDLSERENYYEDLQNQLAEKNTEVSKLQQDVSSMEMNQIQAEGKIQELLAEKEGLERMSEELKMELENTIELITRLETSVSEKSHEAGHLAEVAAELKQALDTRDQEVTSLRSTLEASTKEYESIIAHLKDSLIVAEKSLALKAENSKIREGEMNEQIETLTKERQELARAIQVAQTEFEATKAELERDLASRDGQLQDMNNVLEARDSEIAEMRDILSDSQVILEKKILESDDAMKALESEKMALEDRFKRDTEEGQIKLVELDREISAKDQTIEALKAEQAEFARIKQELVASQEALLQKVEDMKREYEAKTEQDLARFENEKSKLLEDKEILIKEVEQLVNCLSDERESHSVELDKLKKEKQVLNGFVEQGKLDVGALSEQVKRFESQMDESKLASSTWEEKYRILEQKALEYREVTNNERSQFDDLTQQNETLVQEKKDLEDRLRRFEIMYANEIAGRNLQLRYLEDKLKDRTLELETSKDVINSGEKLKNELKTTKLTVEEYTKRIARAEKENEEYKKKLASYQKSSEKHTHELQSHIQDLLKQLTEYEFYFAIWLD